MSKFFKVFVALLMVAFIMVAGLSSLEARGHGGWHYGGLHHGGWHGGWYHGGRWHYHRYGYPVGFGVGIDLGYGYYARPTLDFVWDPYDGLGWVPVTYYPSLGYSGFYSSRFGVHIRVR